MLQQSIDLIWKSVESRGQPMTDQEFIYFELLSSAADSRRPQKKIPETKKKESV